MAAASSALLAPCLKSGPEANSESAALRSSAMSSGFPVAIATKAHSSRPSRSTRLAKPLPTVPSNPSPGAPQSSVAA